MGRNHRFVTPYLGNNGGELYFENQSNDRHNCDARQLFTMLLLLTI